MILKVETQSGSLIRELCCSKCGLKYAPYKLHNTSPCCGAALINEYEYSFSRSALEKRGWNMWRYFELLPVFNQENVITLGEGGTPLIQLEMKIEGLEGRIMMKDESFNPTGSFKARGMSVAISKAKEFGIKKCLAPSAGNAGVAMSAYCARAGIHATVIFPKITPEIYIKECQAYGAEVILIDGLINDCGVKAREINAYGDYFDVSTIKEPYRIEGKKTMGYEIAEALNWKLPDAIVYPTGGGTGLIGIWKAFREMEKLGWISGPLPRMIAVQSENCQPVVEKWENKINLTGICKPSIALGLNVPSPFGIDLICKCLSDSGGTAVAVSEDEIKSALMKIQSEGILPAPEGAAALAGILKLVKSGFLNPTNKILMLNTGSGTKHLIS